MSTHVKSKGMDAVEEAEVLETLLKMEADPQYDTASRYHSNEQKYPGNLITFSQTHLSYLKKFPLVDPYHYVRNLKMMTKC